MAYRNGNYAAFYVAEPFNASALGADFHAIARWKCNVCRGTYGGQR